MQHFRGQGYDRKALDVLERQESRALLEQVGGSAAQRFNGVPPSIPAADRATLADVSAYETAYRASAPASMPAARTALLAALARRSVFEKRMRATYPAYYALLHPVPETLEGLQQTLRPDEALLAYDVLPQKSVVIVVTRDRLAMIPLPGLAALTASVARVRGHIQKLLDDVDGGHPARAGDLR